MSLFVRDTDFVCVLAAVIRENSDNNGESFAVHLST